ncbi:hypothetical protein F5Y14DRAFT_464964 [Nemania sp. NC0429]|nr:hypothetical protein F5Y14DRAFT_464964 [Nemania sp. NC0429]
MNPIHFPDENPAWRDIIVNAVFNTLTIVVIGLRFYSRRLTGAGLGWDDGFIMFSTLLVNAMLIVAGFLISLGFGLPQHEIPHNTMPKIIELGRAFRLLFLFCICTVKLSALFFYLRVFGNHTLHANMISRNTNTNSGGGSGPQAESKKTPVSAFPFLPSIRSCWELVRMPSLRLVYIAFIYVVVVWSVVNVVRELTACGLDKRICAANRVTDLETCVFNSAGDLLIFALPLWPIWRLQMARNAKVGLSIVLMLGTLTILVAFLRFEAIVNTEYAGDYNRTAMKSTNYAILEPNLAILCISLPMLQPLLRKARSHVRIGSRGRTDTEWAGSSISSSSRHRRDNASRGPSAPWSGGEGERLASVTPGSAAYANFDFEPAVPARAGTAGSSGRNNGNPDENLIAKVKRVWSMESRASSSQGDIVELPGRPGISVTRDAETGSFRREDGDWPFTPFRGVTITTITAGHR